jgi:hypothetical protein
MRAILLMMIGLSLLQAEITRDAATGIVSDSVTHLEWQDDAVGSTMTWQSAIDTCENLTLGNYDDWRLPNINELKSIIDRSNNNQAIKDGFTNTSSGSSYYWSSSTREYYKDNAWFVYFGTGYYVYYDYKDDNLYVRCVRDGQ